MSWQPVLAGLEEFLEENPRTVTELSRGVQFFLGALGWGSELEHLGELLEEVNYQELVRVRVSNVITARPVRKEIEVTLTPAGFTVLNSIQRLAKEEAERELLAKKHGLEKRLAFLLWVKGDFTDRKSPVGTNQKHVALLQKLATEEFIELSDSELDELYLEVM